MVSSKRIGFFWGEEKITIVEFDKNIPHQVVSSSLGSKAAAPSPFNSSLTEEIQITAILQKMLQDNQIKGGSFYVSLPMKEIILRSFIIPFVKKEEIQNVIKFEAKKYMPFDIQDLSFVYYSIPFMENQTKRLQIIFFAARNEVLAKYERIFKQVNAQVSYCEPYMVSLSKALLFKKEIKPTDHLAFLILDKNLGRICFIDKGIPQFIREFAVASPVSLSEETNESMETLNLKIINEVGNSFDFYTRQFSGDRIDQMLISSDFIQQDLFNSLEVELKLKLRSFNPVLTPGLGNNPNRDMDAVYAMGACVPPPMESLSVFNFLGPKTSKTPTMGGVIAILNAYKEIIFVFVLCLAVVIGAFVFFHSRLQTVQQEYDRLTSKQGVFLNVPVENIQAESQNKADTFIAYKNIRMKSDVVFVLLRVASHLPQGAFLTQLDIKYVEDNSKSVQMVIDMRGDVTTGDSGEQIAMANQIFSDFRDDKDLSKYVKNINLVSLNREQINNQQATGFNIHCS